ncbi:hypothetical protein WS83_21120 [Burkholderia sp. MSMB2042]|nr:hypothetical protein WS78_27355 [Burkholderia savannae]KVG46243.1 hypothetical protein WS77_31335 [Burkholderia sp. MSMB0265]KVG89609.1 hypothetical protein WS81_21455 [Burkholderia sp. MSMB2040]KVG95858.1 hypothetical protein WS82_04500 [Burkholderia sp. MSMB2041]KVH00842.1 hypothetical protein WS83_21120 [Burkholderia sp. MSMB2042]KVK71550.1 hypothetical protein WS91_23955 [Burkholderia sp. MSMB1498]
MKQAGDAHPDSISPQLPFPGRLVCVSSRRRPDAHEPLTLERLSRARRSNVSISLADSRLIAAMLADMCALCRARSMHRTGSSRQACSIRCRLP